MSPELADLTSPTGMVETILLMMAVLAAVAVAAKRLAVPPSVLLVVAGLGIALVPGLPNIDLPPELILLIFLPPLIYSAGVAMSWREFRFNLRPIALLAFGCVIFTTCAIAVVTHYLLHFSWGVGFLLGAIISPPDVVAPLAVAQKLGLPRRLIVVLEGEGLANDATALVLYRFAVAAVSTGTFSLESAAGEFVMIVVGEIIYGIGVGWLSLRLRQWAQEPRVEITLSLMTPYLAFWVPAHLGGSGVLATVACGLYVSWNGPLLIPYATRLQGIFFWDLVVYLIEGMVFLITGLQVRTLAVHAHDLSIRELVIATLLTTAIAVIARFVWVFPATYIPRWLNPRLRKRDPSPPWQAPFFLAFTGIRGVDSLAVALAIPYTVASGAPFPQRDTILFVTFGIIVITLIGQGSVLGKVAHWLGLLRESKKERAHEIKAELTARAAALEEVTKRLDKAIKAHELPENIARHLRTRNAAREQILPKNLEDGLEEVRETAKVKKELIDAERQFIYQLLQEGKITDEARRRIEYELDLEEASVANRALDGGGWI
jgi:CPA1 family monovalent cation:H+ antiporter